MEQEWERTCKTWAIRKGFLQGVAGNFRDALNESWYSQLKSVHTAYHNTAPIQILEHLNSGWCPLDVHTKKNLCIAYYAEWDREQHLTAFGKHLDDDQVRIKQFGITISNKDKLQFYLEQMYASNHFDKKEMTEWETSLKPSKTISTTQRHTSKDSSGTTKSTSKTAAALPASTTSKVQTKQPRPIAAMNFAST